MKTLLVVATIGSVQPSTAELRHLLDELVETTRVLYVAAHPDDENTQLLAYLVGERHVRATYLSLTRGAGGQNRIGEEQGPMLGVLRTEELLAARRVDGAEQRFSAARDFGYSKSPEETLRIWGHDATLADVVAVIRRVRPHVIITRFPEQGATHGHHIASARLAHEAFDAAGDASRFADQLQDGELSPWQPKRLLWNVSHWMDVPKGEHPEVTVDIGGYDVLRGMSYGELAAKSRSQHRSQAFGSAARHGPRISRLRFVAGDEPTGDPLEGIGSEWDAAQGGEAVRRALERARRDFEPQAPEKALDGLLDAYRALAELDDEALRAWKGRQLLRAIAGCAGLRLAAHTETGRVVPGGSVKVALEAQSRRAAGLELLRVELGEDAVAADAELAPEQVWRAETSLRVPADAPVTTPAWLAEGGTAGRYGVSDRHLATLPRRPPPHRATFVLRRGGTELRLRTAVEHSRTDAVRGEVTTPLLTTPPVTVTPATEVQVAPEGQEREVVITARAAQPGVKGELQLGAPDGWRVRPEKRSLSFDDGTLERELRFHVTPEAGAKAAELGPVARVDGRDWSVSEQSLDYEHIPPRTVLQPAMLRLVPLDVEVPEGRVGYVPGAGDTVATHLAQLGLDVTELDPATLDESALEGLRAVVVGVRAWTAQPELAAKAPLLMRYVEQGGTLLLQYDKAPRRSTRELPLDPLELSIGRDRVTDETAEVQLLAPEHPALSSPNDIGAGDFEGWVQERGLYFAESWSEQMKPLLSMADPGEEPSRGALLVGEHGEGHVVYTGLALFRQLPAGVPGAYRLMANLLSLGDAEASAATTSSEQSPPFGQWKHWYLAVAAVLLGIIGLLYWITKRFS